MTIIKSIAIFSIILVQGVLTSSMSQVSTGWVQQTSGLSIALDNQDNVYTVNYDYNPGGDIYLTKRNSNGDFIWVASYNNTDPTKFESATWVATDNLGNIIVSGTVNSGYSNPVKANSIIMKFNSQGNLLWRQVYEGSFDGSYTKKCVVDKANNIYVLGTGAGPGGIVSKVKKFDPDGNSPWSYFDNAGIGLPLNIKFAADSNLVISARAMYGSINGYAKIDRNGNHIWSYPGINSLTTGDADGDAYGNTYIVNGEYVMNGGTVLTRLSPSGSIDWQNTYSLSALRVEVGTDNFPVICGYPNSGSFGSSFLKTDGNGTILWSNPDADGPSYNFMLHAHLIMDEMNNIYLAAGAMSAMGFVKVNHDGTSGWVTTTPGSYANAIAIGTDHHVYATGGTTVKLLQQDSQASLDIKAYLQGPFLVDGMSNTLLTNGFLPLSQPYNTQPWNYNGTESLTVFPNNNITDWVLVELRKTSGDAVSATSDSVIMQKAAFMLTDGAIVDLDGVSPLMINPPASGNLYLVIWHRNHLPVMSSVPLVAAGGSYMYDFTDGAEKTYGGSSGTIQTGNGSWGMVAGDGNSDGQVNNPDKTIIWKPQTGSNGYKSGDFNMDGQVNNPDKNLFWAVNTGLGTQVPE